jgi:hypothetical protein
MSTFYASGEFPSFKPIRTTAGKVLELIAAKLPNVTDAAIKAELTELQTRLGKVATDKQIYLTIATATHLGII